ncbi:glycerol dehydrogenase [Acinetobacter rudis]|uniref:glycerol dehydrogenase n=1 Tax=Acinetobacter rudis TaxID=632955 RepID=UPI003342A7FA
MLKIMGFPGEYIQGEHALSSIGDIANRQQFKKIGLIYDPATEGHILNKVTKSLSQSNVEYICYKFAGECTYKLIAYLTQTIQQHGIDSLIALGGGKAMDTTKGISKRLHIPMIICPTVASSDAPTSRLIIIYDDQHKVQAVEKTQRNPDIVLVDLDTIVHAPARFFAAGIGDAISKMFEVNQCKKAHGLNSFSTSPLETALLLANHTYYNLMQWGKMAYEDVKQHQISVSVERVVESTVLLSGLAFESGGLSLAHALIRGLTAIPELASQLHGELVAYGTVVQAVLENREHQFIIELINFLRSVDLPTTLYELGYQQEISDDMLDLIITNTLQNDYSQHFEPALNSENLRQAIIRTNHYH